MRSAASRPVVLLAVLLAAAARPAAAQTPSRLGAVCDGASHPLSASFGDLTAARQKFPEAAALTDELDAVAINHALNTARTVTLPATPVGRACVANIPILMHSGNTLAGAGMGRTVLRWTLAPGATRPDYATGVVIGLPERAPGQQAIADAHIRDLTIDGGWPADGQHLGNPSPVTGQSGRGLQFGPRTSDSDATRVEVLHENGGAAVYLSGSNDTVQDSKVHDNWGNGIYIHGEFSNASGVRQQIFATGDRILNNTLWHNSLQNYPARNANGGYGGSPELITGNGPVFVFFPAGPNDNCPGARKCLGSNDGIDLDPGVRSALVQGNTVYGNDMLALDLGDRAARGFTPGSSGGIVFTGNRIIASPTGGASINGYENNVSVTGNRFEKMLDSLSANTPQPPTLAQQLAGAGDHGCGTINGAATAITWSNNFCEGGTVGLDYRTFPPSEVTGFRTHSAAFGLFSHGVRAPDGEVLVPSNVTISGNTFVNLGQPGNPTRHSVVDFNLRNGAPRDYTITNNTFQDTRGLARAPYDYSIDLRGAGGRLAVSSNRVLPGALGTVSGSAQGQ